ncbi:cell division protein ZapE [Streptomyces sp. NPDC127092]|uniref:cell division protein ZapE n=1 Tax=Streptomyces sp. NPDC127092 TaxID=3347135 RepID=UPI00364F1CC9
MLRHHHEPRDPCQEMRAHFRRSAEDCGFTLSEAQERAAERLSLLAGELAEPHGLFHRPARAFGLVRPDRPARGLYLWGPVGRGKSWLVDTFFDGLVSSRKRRLHFHDFFRELHDGVSRDALSSDRPDGPHNAVERSLDTLLGDCRVLFFDEFHVHDAGDAMLVARLLRTLVDRGVTLVTTSNYPPAGLLPDPVHHHLFAPTIELIEARMDVLDVSGPTDYRQQQAVRADGSRRFAEGACLTHEDDALLDLGIPAPRPAEAAPVPVHRRTLPARAIRAGLVWLGFDVLCEGTTAVPDYLALAEHFDTLVLDGVPPLTDCTPDTRRRFANLVDVCCDRDVRLVLVGADPLADLTGGTHLMRDLDRTASRLAMLRRPAGTP